jgi:hypothetical protein
MEITAKKLVGQSGILPVKTRVVLYCHLQVQDLIRVIRLSKQKEGIQLRPAEPIHVFHAIETLDAPSS